MNQIKRTIVSAVKKAGKNALKEYGRFKRGSIHLKPHNEAVTRVDLMSEETIIMEIKRNFPAHKILSEESGRIRGTDDYLWIIDPIDGTTNFIMHNPLWSVSVALARGDTIILGVIYAPALGELYVAEAGRGAKLNGHKIKVSRVSQGKVLHAFCHGRKKQDVKKVISYFSERKRNELNCRQLGSAALELAYVAAGRLDSIMIPGGHAWDIAAGVLMVEEAGGLITDFKGGPWTLKSRDMIASNKLVHREVLDVIRQK